MDTQLLPYPNLSPQGTQPSRLLQGGNARETTVAKMVEEVEAHALFERTAAALARATGSRRIPKLRPSPSSPTGWALATQQSIQTMPLHKLMHKTSIAADVVRDHGSINLGSENQPCSRLQHQHGDFAPLGGLFPAQRQVHTGHVNADNLQETPVLSREAQLLSACYHHIHDIAPASSDRQVLLQSMPDAAKAGSTADLGEAIIVEEKYHRAGRDVMGQRVDHAAAALAVAEHAQRQRKIQQQQLGYKPLRHSIKALDSHSALMNKCLADTDECHAPRVRYSSAI